ncbi:MAG: hypothetical protein U0169_13140 [Polyangiaceae bacterium]
MVPLAILAHCSLINSFDDVVPEGTDGGAVTPTLDGSTDAQTTGDVATSETGSDAATTADADASGPKSGGAIVAIASDIDNGGTAVPRTQLVVIDPRTGQKFPNTASEFITDAGADSQAPSYDAVVYDRDKDLWYVIVRETPPPSPITVQVRRLNPTTGQWIPWGGTNSPISRSLQHLPSPSNGKGNYVAMNGRLVYTADPAPGATHVADVFEIDVDPDAGTPTFREAGAAPLNMSPTGLVASPQDNVINYFAMPQCGDGGVTPDGGACLLAVDSVTVPVTPSSVAHRNLTNDAAKFTTVGSTAGIAAGGLYERGTDREVFLAVPRQGAGSRIFGLQPSSFDPGSHGSEIAMPGSATNRRYAPLAIAECSLHAFYVDQIADKLLYALPLTGVSPMAASTTHEQTNMNIAFEPFTSSVVVYGVASGERLTEFNAFRFDTMPLALNRRTDTSALPWKAPTNLAVRSLAIRRPRGFTCE